MAAIVVSGSMLAIVVAGDMSRSAAALLADLHTFLDVPTTEPHQATLLSNTSHQPAACDAVTGVLPVAECSPFSTLIGDDDGHDTSTPLLYVNRSPAGQVWQSAALSGSSCAGGGDPLGRCWRTHELRAALPAARSELSTSSPPTGDDLFARCWRTRDLQSALEVARALNVRGTQIACKRQHQSKVQQEKRCQQRKPQQQPAAAAAVVVPSYMRSTASSELARVGRAAARQGVQRLRPMRF